MLRHRRGHGFRVGCLALVCMLAWLSHSLALESGLQPELQQTAESSTRELAETPAPSATTFLHKVYDEEFGRLCDLMEECLACPSTEMVSQHVHIPHALTMMADFPPLCLSIIG